MLFVDLAARWLHILAAITLVGGTFFMRFAYGPSVKMLTDEQRHELQGAVRGRWSKLVMMSAGFLLLSGFYNAAMIPMRFTFKDAAGDYLHPFGGLYNPLLGVKLLLALVVFFVASALSGRSEQAEKFRQKETMWLNVNVVLSITLVCVAGIMKLADREPKTEEPDGATQTAPLAPDSQDRS